MADPVSRLGEIKARRDAATPGPWRQERFHGDRCSVNCDDPTCFLYIVVAPSGMLGDVKDMEPGDVLYLERTPAEAEADAAFIAAAPADVGWLLEHIEQLQRDIVQIDSAYASKASECTDLHGLCMRQRKELAGLRSFAQSLLTLETDMKARAGAGLGTIIDQARTALGADDDR